MLRRVVSDVARLPCELARSARRRAAQPVAIVRSIVALTWAGLSGRPSTPASPVSEPARRPRRDPGAGRVAPDAEPTGDVTAVDLPIENYESLAASQVVARLERLDADELAQIAEFEAAHRGRRTVLGKIDQLTAAAG